MKSNFQLWRYFFISFAFCENIYLPGRLRTNFIWGQKAILEHLEQWMPFQFWRSDFHKAALRVSPQTSSRLEFPFNLQDLSQCWDCAKETSGWSTNWPWKWKIQQPGGLSVLRWDWLYLGAILGSSVVVAEKFHLRTSLTFFVFFSYHLAFFTRKIGCFCCLPEYRLKWERCMRRCPHRLWTQGK